MFFLLMKVDNSVYSCVNKRMSSQLADKIRLYYAKVKFFIEMFYLIFVDDFLFLCKRRKFANVMKGSYFIQIFIFRFVFGRHL